MWFKHKSKSCKNFYIFDKKSRYCLPIVETANLLIISLDTILLSLISKFLIVWTNSWTFSDWNRTPFSNKLIISLGPEGQSDDIIFFPKIWASINELPRPSLLEGKKNISAKFKYFRGLSTFPIKVIGKSEYLFL